MRYLFSSQVSPCFLDFPFTVYPKSPPATVRALHLGSFPRMYSGDIMAEEEVCALHVLCCSPLLRSLWWMGCPVSGWDRFKLVLQASPLQPADGLASLFYPRSFSLKLQCQISPLNDWGSASFSSAHASHMHGLLRPVPNIKSFCLVKT